MKAVVIIFAVLLMCAVENFDHVEAKPKNDVTDNGMQCLYNYLLLFANVLQISMR